MKNIIIREPKIEDKENFLQAMQHSQLLHSPMGIHVFEDYEKLKAHIEEDLAREIIHKYQLPEASLICGLVFFHEFSFFIFIFYPIRSD